jgi:hypothetical protein
LLLAKLALGQAVQTENLPAIVLGKGVHDG